MVPPTDASAVLMFVNACTAWARNSFAAFPPASTPVWPATKTRRCGPLTSTTWLYAVGCVIPDGLECRTFVPPCACAEAGAAAQAAAAAVTAVTKSRRDADRPREGGESL